MLVPMIAGNWKMNTTVSEAIYLVNEMGPGLEEIDNVKKVICPPFISLAVVKDLMEETSIKLGAQNMHFAEKGAYTGEISPLMLANLCEFVIIGHSERRQYCQETGQIINKKILAALNAGLKPILCVGERLEENVTGRTKQVVTEQLKSSLAGINDIKDLVIAYEPVWAIGTGKAATGEQANETIGLIRQNISELYAKETSRDTLILYGGSVNADNTTEFMNQPNINGALVGGASLEANQFVSIVKQTSLIKAVR